MTKATKPMRTLTIDRAVWYRGQGPEESKLLRSEDGRRCCIGLYLQACGVPDNALRGKPVAVQLFNIALPPEADWTQRRADEEVARYFRQY